MLVDQTRIELISGDYQSPVLAVELQVHLWSSMTDLNRRYLVGNEKYCHYTNRALDQDKGIEPSPSAWKAEALPLCKSWILVLSAGLEPTATIL